MLTRSSGSNNASFLFLNFLLFFSPVFANNNSLFHSYYLPPSLETSTWHELITREEREKVMRWRDDCKKERKSHANPNLIFMNSCWLLCCCYDEDSGGHGHSHGGGGGGGHGHSHSAGGGAGGHSHSGSPSPQLGHGGNHHHHLPSGDDGSASFRGVMGDGTPSTPSPEPGDTSSNHSKSNDQITKSSNNQNNGQSSSGKSAPQPTSSQQLNMRGVFLHVLADALGSVIVCASACIFIFTDFRYKDYVDPTLSVLMVCLILYSTWGLLIESAMILLQTVPTHIQVDSLQRKLLQEVRTSIHHDYFLF